MCTTSPCGIPLHLSSHPLTSCGISFVFNTFCDLVQPTLITPDGNINVPFFIIIILSRLGGCCQQVCRIPCRTVWIFEAQHWLQTWGNGTSVWFRHTREFYWYYHVSFAFCWSLSFVLIIWAYSQTPLGGGGGCLGMYVPCLNFKTRRFMYWSSRSCHSWYTAISWKVVGKSACDNPEMYCGWFWVHCSSKKVDRMAWEAIDICLRVVKENNKSRFDSYKVRNSVLIISHITFQDCRVHISSDKLSRNSCICFSFVIVLNLSLPHLSSFLLCPMSLFQGHVACWNSSLTGPPSLVEKRNLKDGTQ